MSGPYNNRSRGRGGNRPYNNQNKNIRRTHDYQQPVQPQHQVSNTSSQELNNGVYANERFMHTTMALIGAIAKVMVKSGKVYEGVFKTYSPKFEVVLDKVHEVDPANPSNIPFREEIKPQMVFKLEDIASVLYTNVDPYFAIADGFTDSAISRKTNGQAMEKELQPWVSDSNPDDMLDDGDILESGKSNGWDAMDMFRTNRDKFQIESTYDPNMGQYTTPMPDHNTEEFKVYEENAAAVAREIESSQAYKQRIELENTKDEETLHSAVTRDSQSGPSKGHQQRQDRGQYSEKSGPRTSKPYITPLPAVPRESSPIGRQQVSKAATSGVQGVADIVNTPHGSYGEASVKKHIASIGSAQNHGQQAHNSAAPSVAPQTCQGTLVSSSSASGTPASGVNGFKHHVLPEQQAIQPSEWKDGSAKAQHAPGAYVASSTQQQQGGDVIIVGGHHHHHQYQQPVHHKDVTIAEQIKDLKEFQVNFNLTDIPTQTPASLQQQQPLAQAATSAIESLLIQPVTTVAIATSQMSDCIAHSAPSVVTTPTSSKSLSASEGSLAAVESSEKKKEVTYTLNPNAHEFRPRNVPLDPSMAQVVHPMQILPAANMPQQPPTPAHVQVHKGAQMSNSQVGGQQGQQLGPSTVGSPPIIYPSPTGLQQFAMAPHPTPILYCPQTVTPRYSGGAKRATVSARGNNDGATPQATNIMAGAPLISQNGLPPMFVTPQQMMINPPYLNNSLRFMTPCPVILEHVPHNPMLLSASMIPPLAAPPHGTPTAIMHPLLQQQQQQIVAQQSQQTTNNSNGGAGARPNSNGSGAPTPVHYQPGHPMSQQAQSHHQQQQQTPMYGTPTSMSIHGPQQMNAPSGSQMPSSLQSQMLFSPFIPTFANHHPQSASFAAAIPPPVISGAMQGQQVPPGAALHHHQLVQHHQFQPMIIASQNQQVAAAQLGQFVAVPGLPQGPPNMASPQLLYGMPPALQQSMTGQNFQHGQ